jgi:DNA-binding MarR family transcriptional regulator
MTKFGTPPRIEAPKKELPRFDDPMAWMKRDAKAADKRRKKMDKMVSHTESQDDKDRRHAFYLRHVSDTKPRSAREIGNDIGLTEKQGGQLLRTLYDRGFIDREMDTARSRFNYIRNENGREFVKEVLG